MDPGMVQVLLALIGLISLIVTSALTLMIAKMNKKVNAVVQVAEVAVARTAEVIIKVDDAVTKTVELGTKVDEYHSAVNSKVDLLIVNTDKLARSEARANGIIEGTAMEKNRSEDASRAQELAKEEGRAEGKESERNRKEESK